MRAKVFRLTQSFMKDETEKIQEFIDKLWEKVYNEANDDDLWDYISTNLLFGDGKKASGKQGAYEMKSNRAFNTSRLAKIAVPHHQVHQKICGSMLLYISPTRPPSFSPTSPAQRPSAPCAFTHRLWQIINAPANFSSAALIAYILTETAQSTASQFSIQLTVSTHVPIH